MRQTKIIATIGPAISSTDAMESIIRAGVDVVRLNFSHGDFSYHAQNVHTARTIAKKLGKNIGILIDLPGPKLRIKQFKEGSVELIFDASFVIDTQFNDLGDTTIVGVDYPDLIYDCAAGDYLLLDDGNIELVIEEIVASKIHTRVVQGGTLSNNKGLNRKGGGLSAPAIGEKDEHILAFCAEHAVDFIAVSFVSHASDIKKVQKINARNDCKALIIAKIERAELVNDEKRLAAVLDVTDGVMVARGDLAVEVGVSELVGHQKKLISTAIQADKFIIMATQMMESMTHAPNPTRAEVSDVGNAVLDGVDAVMLSGETAVGSFPVHTVEAMVDVCLGNEKHTSLIAQHKQTHIFSRIDKATAASAVQMARSMPSVGALVCFTESGAMPRWVSRYSIQQPIVAITRHKHAYNAMSILRNVFAYYVEYDELDTFLHCDFASTILQNMIDTNLVEQDDYIIVSHGFPSQLVGYTNSVALYSVRTLLDTSIALL